ncbi:MAG TPA: prolyl oligopeptidase family serine peptidase [Ktedonobacteraceae bacterium]|nr:prolyl oligopeptidase family serine peptidase [Ktedonobacteraceae bacterium]
MSPLLGRAILYLVITYRHPPILLIHGMKDEAVPISHAYQIAKQARACGISLETYLVEDAAHCDAYAHDPQGYIHVLQQFLALHLGNDFPHGHGCLKMA